MRSNVTTTLLKYYITKPVCFAMKSVFFINLFYDFKWWVDLKRTLLSRVGNGCPYTSILIRYHFCANWHVGILTRTYINIFERIEDLSLFLSPMKKWTFFFWNWLKRNATVNESHFSRNVNRGRPVLTLFFLVTYIQIQVIIKILKYF